MSRPFEGVRVIDASQVLAGPFAAYQLAILGADVIKVEPPDELDQVREQGPDETLNAMGMGTYFLTQGANKRSVTLNLKHADGQQILRELVRSADVFIENYRVGALAGLKLDYASLSALNSALIYCSVTAFGQDGPRARHNGYDFQIQATSGVMASTGTPAVNPIKVGPPVIDYATGTMTAFAIASALFQRQQTGRGQYIDLAMFDVALMMMSADVTNYLWSGEPPVPRGNDYPLAGSRCYPTKEGLLMLGAMNRRQHARLWQLFGRDDIAAETDYGPRWDKGDDQAGLLTTIFAAKTATQWETDLQAAGIPAARVRTLPEALADPQLETRAVLHRFDEPLRGDESLSVPVTAFKYAHGGPAIDRPPPRPGQDSASVLRELGYADGDIADLRKRGTI